MRIPNLVKNPLAAIRMRLGRQRKKKYLKSIGSPREIFFSRKQILEKGYFSQDGQDMFVAEEYFPGKRDGVFVDVGANDGVTFSNSYFFEKHLGWGGLALEPIPQTFAKLRAARSCICEQVCASDKVGKSEFLCVPGHGEMLSGLVEFQAETHRKRIEAYENVKKSEIIAVQCLPLADLLAKHSLSNIDFLSVDTEGSEMAVLMGVDWDRIKISVIAIENNYYSLEIYRFLQTMGFSCVARFTNDEIYARV